MRTKNTLVCGVGVNDYTGSVVVGNKVIKSYDCWSHMIGRCYSKTTQNKQPTYTGCSVCDEWKYFGAFKRWYDENYVDGFALDKDILVEGNKLYSPDTCRCVPTYLNNLLTNRRSYRGVLPVGITIQKQNIKARRINSTYLAQCQDGHGKQLTKTFKTILEAQEWYSATKKRIVKEQATRAFLDNAIKTDVYLALVRREFVVS